MWITKNGVSKDFYDSEDLRSFLDGLLPMDTSIPIPPWNPPATGQNARPKASPQHGRGQTTTLQISIPGDEI
ncbi:hypothetical protein NDU88_005754 [Pleurodeles waltl]|uniref:Uncharacterized protein n=1 Tax=Pleurodeles waltl TaxID=8319 RepID=A0AAV7MBF1_PLEWA|nr:hypothetical protein NDU88_005754 [Pleurodeles waltl]